jgi:hypothetical protein
VTAGWYYQIEGFEAGPVPLAEMNRLILKGRITPQTLVRQDSGSWVVAERAKGLFASAEAVEPGAPPAPEPWHMTLLARFATPGIPAALALLPWGKLAQSLGLLILAVFAAALVRLLVEAGRDLKTLATSQKPESRRS